MSTRAHINKPLQKSWPSFPGTRNDGFVGEVLDGTPYCDIIFNGNPKNLITKTRAKRTYLVKLILSDFPGQF